MINQIRKYNDRINDRILQTAIPIYTQLYFNQRNAGVLLSSIQLEKIATESLQLAEKLVKEWLKYKK